MKKLLSMLVIIMVIVSACGDNGTNPGTPVNSNTELLAPHAQKLISDGDQMLDNAVSSYTNLPDEIRDRVKKVADYAMFPLYYSETKTFSQRMKTVFTGENNFVNAHALIMANVSNTTPSPSVRGRMAISRGISMEDIEDGANAAKVLFPAAAPFIEIGVGILDFFGFGGPSVEEQIQDQVEENGRKLDQVLQEMRQGFNIVNQRLDLVITRLSDLKGDINLATTGIDIGIQNQFIVVKNNFKGFTDLYKVALNITEASNTAFNYMNNAGQFETDLNNVIDISKNLQTWALVNDQYIYETVENDPSTSSNLVRININTISQSTNIILTYPNTKKLLIMSLGGFEYVAKMLRARLNMNKILYKNCADRKAKNKILAQSYLDLLETKGVWANGQNIIDIIQARYQYYRDGFDNHYFHDWFAGAANSDYLYVYENGNYLASYYNTPTAIQSGDNVRGGLLRQRDSVLKEYMMIWLVKLAQLKVELQSYL